jgi:hypothetical protein
VPGFFVARSLIFLVESQVYVADRLFGDGPHSGSYSRVREGTNSIRRSMASTRVTFTFPGL